MTELHLLIDDLRELQTDLVVRTSADGKQALIDHPVTHLYMDHDLGEMDGEFRNGYEVLAWALENGRCPPNVLLVTWNSVGRKNMEQALEASGYRRNGNWYTKEQN
jgi:CheY-like chemotaxis protein